MSNMLRTMARARGVWVRSKTRGNKKKHSSFSGLYRGHHAGGKISCQFDLSNIVKARKHGQQCRAAVK